MTQTRLAHITDLHFGAADDVIVQALLDELNADPPDLVVVSGDLTQGARASEFVAAKTFLSKLSAPSLAVPGNHDISPYHLFERFTDPYARWRRFISRETSPSWVNENVAVLGLNSARRLGLHWDWSRGRITRHRLAALVARLDALPESLFRIVVVHHPLLPPENAPETTTVGGAASALRTLGAHRVRLILAGHLHRGYARFASNDRREPLILQSATSTSIRLRGEPNAYNKISISAGGDLQIQVRVWNGKGWQDGERVG
jgi:3',5'-cyclic AMP phosphodiesterase CpdA